MKLLTLLLALAVAAFFYWGIEVYVETSVRGPFTHKILENQHER